MEENETVTARDSTPTARPAARRGASIGRFVTLDVLGSGGMGVVLSAHDPELDRQVAIKLLRRDGWSPRGQLRLQREAQAMARLSHPNVVAVYEVGRVGDQAFIVMELVAGETLRAWIEARPRPWREVIAMFVAAGRGVAAAHAAGLVHRDFKPSNVLVAGDGRPRVSDFGLVASGLGPVTSAADTDAPLTATSSGERSLGGTPAYMSPEQWDGRDVDARADQFAFAVALWEALWGTRPFEGATIAELGDVVRSGRIASIAATRGVPRAIEVTLRRALAPSPADRWPSLDELLDHLARLARPPSARWIPLGMGVASVAITGAIVAWPAQAERDPCAHAADDVAEVWPRLRDQTRVALAGVAHPHAPEIAVRVQAHLDAYAGALRGSRIESCKATHVRRRQSTELLDRRSACLDERQRAFAALLPALVADPQAALADAIKATAALPLVATCSDNAQLNAAMAPPSPAQRARVAALTDRLAQLRARESAGQLEGLAVDQETLERDVRAIGYPPLLAEAVALRGDLRYWRDRDAAAALAAYQEAVDLAARARKDDLTRRMQLGLLEVTAMLKGDLTAAEAMLPVVRAAVTTGGDVTSDRGTLLVLEGNLLAQRSRFEEARVRLEEAIAIRERAAGPNALGVGAALNTLGNIHQELGRYADARATFERAVKVFEALGGSHDANLAFPLTGLGILTYEENDYAASRRFHERVIEIRTATLGAEHLLTAQALGNLANTIAAAGDPAEARVLQERALAIQEKVHGPRHLEVARNLGNLGAFLVQLEALDDAREVLGRSLAIKLEVYGEDHASTAYTLDVLGHLERTAKRWDLAIELGERSLRIRRKVLGDDHPMTAQSWRTLAYTQHAAGRCTASIASSEQAMRILDERSPDDPDLIPALLLAADCWKPRDRRHARALAERAWKLADTDAIPASIRGQTAMTLAELSRDRSLMTRARDLLREAGPTLASELRKADAWLAAHRR